MVMATNTNDVIGVNLGLNAEQSLMSFTKKSKKESNITQEEMSIQHLHTMLADHPYVSVELPKTSKYSGYTLHITRSEDEPGRINVHATSDKFTPHGSRYSSLEPDKRNFVGADNEFQEEGSPSLTELIRDACDFVQLRSEMHHILNIERQGFYEPIERQDLGLPDTGGETLFAAEQSSALTKFNTVVTVVNQGGCNHPTNHDVRVGMHYKADFVDLYFPTIEGKDFIAKEDTFPEYDFDKKDKYGFAETTKDGIYGELAEQLMRTFKDRKIDHVIGHYACGAAVAYEFTQMRKESDNPIPTHSSYFLHSTGYMKEERVKGQSPEKIATYNLPRRKELERYLFTRPDIHLFSVSSVITESVKSASGADIQGINPAGIDPEKWRRRGDRKKTDSSYNEIWTKLALQQLVLREKDLLNKKGDKILDVTKIKKEANSKLKTEIKSEIQSRVEAGETLSTKQKNKILKEELSKRAKFSEKAALRLAATKLIKDSKDNCKKLMSMMSSDIRNLRGRKIVTETSRTVSTKGKDDILRAFKVALDKSDDKNMMLVINIADPDPRIIKDSFELEHVKELHKLVKDLGLENNIIYQPSFTSEEVSYIGQVSDIFISDAKMETWGMSVQQACANGLLLISSKSVPFAEQELRGEEDEVEIVDCSAGGKDSSYEVGEGCILFESGDYTASGSAIFDYLYNSKFNKQIKNTVVEKGHSKSVSGTWYNNAKDMLEKVGFHLAGKSTTTFAIDSETPIKKSALESNREFKKTENGFELVNYKIST